MNKKILLVDDDNDYRESIRDILEINGYEIIEANDGKMALKILESTSVDIVLTDILMPEVEGNQLALKLKRSYPDIPILGMTGGGRLLSPEMVSKTTSNLLFKTVLIKPFSSDELLINIRALG